MGLSTKWIPPHPPSPQLREKPGGKEVHLEMQLRDLLTWNSENVPNPPELFWYFESGVVCCVLRRRAVP